MLLSRIVEEIDGPAVHPDAEVSGVAYDSRDVRPGDLFVAVRGGRVDGNRFAAEALRRGAVAVVSGAEAPAGWAGAPWIRVADERSAMGRAAAAVHGHPDLEIPVIGITGTNGKTTTAYVLESILTAAGMRPGVVGTVSYRWPGHESQAERTTPESADLFRLLRGMTDAGCRGAILEVSSHALAMRRVEAVAFAVGAFTNLSRDHLDYHGDMETYFEAKAKLFDSLPAGATAVINADDPHAGALGARTRARVSTYGGGAGSDVRLLRSEGAFGGSTALLATPAGEIRIESALPGRPNLWNVMAATAIALALEVDPEAIARGVRNLPGVPGRFERIPTGRGFEVIVDFAHSDDALRNLLAAVRSLSPTRVITVFGCGGERDRGKRPRMGEAAASGSDVVILTSDNPRGEDPEAILDDAEVGVRRTMETGGRKIEFHREVDRREAIALALSLARPGDGVVIAGKGHETTQDVGNRSLPFDDRDVCRDLLGERPPDGNGG